MKIFVAAATALAGEFLASRVRAARHELVESPDLADLVVVDPADHERVIAACTGDVPVLAVDVRPGRAAADRLADAGVVDFPADGASLDEFEARLARLERRFAAGRPARPNHREQDDRLRASFEDAAIGMATISLEGRWLTANRALCKLLGYSAGELQRTTFQALTHPEDLDAGAALLHDLVAGRLRNFETEKRYLHRDGHVVWVQLNTALVRDPRGAPLYFLSQMQDITARKAAEEERDRYFSLSVDLLAAVARDGRLERVNPAWAKALGHSTRRLIGRNVLGLVHRDDRAAVAAAAAQLDEVRGAIGVRVRVRGAGGGYRWISWNSSPVTGDERVYCIGRDVTDLVLAEEAVREREERLRAIVETAADGIIVLDGEGCIESLNPAAERLFGYPIDEVRGRHVTTLMPESSREQHARAIERYLATGEKHVIGVRSEVEGLRRDGTTFPVELMVSEMNAGGRRMFTGILRDVTERKEAEEALRRSEERFRTAFESLQDVYYRTDAWGTVTEISPSIEKHTGYTVEEMIGQRVVDAFVRKEDNLALVRLLTAEGSVNDFEAVLRAKDGRGGPVSINAAIIRNAEGRLAGVQGTIRDITERKEAERALHEAERRYRTLFEEAPAMYVITRDAGSEPLVADCNNLFLSTLGYSREDVIGRPLTDFYTPESREALLGGAYERALRGEIIVTERRLVARDGHIVEALLRTAPEPGAEGERGMRGMFIDVTARNRAEEAVRESDQRFSRAFHMSPVAMAIGDASDGRCVDANERFFELAGYDRAEVIGRTAAEVDLWVDPAVHATAIRRARAEGEVRDVEEQIRTRSGEIRDILFSASPAVVHGRPCMIGALHDITARKRAEREQQEILAALRENSQVLAEQAAEMDTLRAEAEYRANHDMLTGVMNRRAWFAAAVAQRPTALALFDIDGFKRVNDEHGHAAGDAVIREVAQRLAAALGENPLGRVGGEEFAAVFRCSPFEARDLSERAVAEVSRRPVVLPSGESLQVTVSAGMAAWDASRRSREESLANTYEEADRLLYRAKEQGRDRVVVATDRAA